MALQEVDVRIFEHELIEKLCTPPSVLVGILDADHDSPQSKFSLEANRPPQGEPPMRTGVTKMQNRGLEVLPLLPLIDPLPARLQ